jgi:hypothetical protein
MTSFTQFLKRLPKGWWLTSLPVMLNFLYPDEREIVGRSVAERSTPGILNLFKAELSYYLCQR